MRSKNIRILAYRRTVERSIKIINLSAWASSDCRRPSANVVMINLLQVGESHALDMCQSQYRILVTIRLEIWSLVRSQKLQLTLVGKRVRTLKSQLILMTSWLLFSIPKQHTFFVFRRKNRGIYVLFWAKFLPFTSSFLGPQVTILIVYFIYKYSFNLF